MFFADRIKQIQPNDKVLEIGPGAHPHPRSNVLLELEYGSEEARSAQFGHSEKLNTDKKIVYYTGQKFPFADKEFDYVICSHVLEHVPDVPGFLSEIFRVSPKGYFEYPLVYYDYLYNFDVHLNFVKYNEGVLSYMKKKNSGLDHFLPVQELFNTSLKKGHVALVNDLLPLLMEGFEWNKPFEVKEAKSLSEVCHLHAVVPDAKVNLPPTRLQLFKQLIRTLVK
jgi:SAM-dependent methyltransferase